MPEVMLIDVREPSDVICNRSFENWSSEAHIKKIVNKIEKKKN